MVLEEQLVFDFMKEKSLSQKLLEGFTRGLLGTISLSLIAFLYLATKYKMVESFGGIEDYFAAGMFVGTGIAIGSLIPMTYKTWNRRW